jgi:hypothetical protein
VSEQDWETVREAALHSNVEGAYESFARLRQEREELRAVLDEKVQQLNAWMVQDMKHQRENTRLREVREAAKGFLDATVTRRRVGESQEAFLERCKRDRDWETRDAAEARLRTAINNTGGGE